MQDLLEERLKKWKDKLIDLSKRNRLLNFRPTKVTTIKIEDERPPEILNILTIEKEGMEFLPVADTDEENLFKEKEDKIDSSVEFQSYAREEVADKHIDKYLQTTLPKERLLKNLLRIYSKASSVMEEQGYNVLFLSLGCLEWYESEGSDIRLKAPIILVPVELSRKSVKSKFKLKYNEEESLILNPALIVKLQKDFGITLNPIDEELENNDLQQIFSQIQAAIQPQERWRVTNDIYLSLFSFAKFIMYKDIDKYLQILLNHPIIKLVCGQSTNDNVSLDLEFEERDLDNILNPIKTFQILDADSSQQRAIFAVKSGKNLVIEGPPGTGKSQTIANIIAEFLAEDKKVLFVSQKMAALEVVKKRLDNNGLGDFCFELHSRKTNKSEVIKELVRVLEMQKKPDHSHDEDITKLRNLKEELNDYVKVIHTPYSKLEMTPYQAFGIMNSHPEIQDISFVFNKTKELERKEFNTFCDLLDNLAHHLSNIHNPTQHPWYGTQITEMHYQDKLRIIETMDSVINTCSEVQNLAEILAKHLFFRDPSSIVDIEKLLEANKLLLNSPDISKQILQDARLDTISTNIEEIIKTVKSLHTFMTEIESQYYIEYLTSQNIDIDSLIVRYGKYSRNPFFFFSRSFWQDRNLMRKHLLNKNYKPNFIKLTGDLKKIKEGKLAIEKIKSSTSFCKSLFGNIWNGLDTKWENLDKFSKWMVEFRNFVNKGYFNDIIFDGLAQNKIDFESCKANSISLSKAL